MTIKLNDEKQVELHYSLRIYMLYESITGEPINFSNFNKVENLITLFYCAVLASCQYHKIEWNTDFDGFMEIIDNNGGIHYVNAFADWFSQSIAQQKGIIKDIHETSEEQKND